MGSPHAYLLALLDVVVLPDVGAPDEHDFELLLMSATEERGEVPHQLMGENRSVLWGLEGAWAHLGEATGLFLHPAPSVFEVCPLHSHPRVPVHVQEPGCLRLYMPVSFCICVLVDACVFV